MFRLFRGWIIAIMLVLGLSGCGYNTLQSQDEAANAAWSEVLNQYQRRADLVPNLVNTENRIALARNRYIQTVQIYNTTLRSFPNNITAKIFGMHIRPNFVPENEAAVKQAPQVQF